MSSFIVIHYNFAALFLKQDIFIASFSKKTPKKQRFYYFLTDIIYLKS